jgi:hypothetical protein
MQNGFEWRRMDGAGFYYGFYKEGEKPAYRLDIAVPGGGLQTKNLRQHEIIVNGELKGTASSVDEAKKFLSEYFGNGLHKGRAPSLQDKLSGIRQLISGKGRGGR